MFVSATFLGYVKCLILKRNVEDRNPGIAKYAGDFIVRDPYHGDADLVSLP
jgi:hypothetical protein